MPESLKTNASKGPSLMAELSATFRRPLQRYFQRRVGDFQEAEDLVQDLFVRMVRKSDIDQVENMQAYVFRAAVNMLRDRSRQAFTANTAKAQFTAANTDQVEVVSPEHVLQSKQSLQLVVSALSTLNPQVRHAFILNRVEGMKHAEIADIFGLSVSSIKKYIVKADIHIKRYSDLNRK